MVRTRRGSLAFSLLVIVAFTVVTFLGTAPIATRADTAGFALDFDGVNDYVVLNKTSYIFQPGWESEKTVNFWFKPRGPGVACPYGWAWCPAIVGDRPQWWGITRGVINGQDRIWLWNYSNNRFQYVGIQYTPDEWVNIAMVHSGGVMRAIKNGVEVGSVASGPTQQPITGAYPTLHLGGIIATSTAIFITNGAIDEVRLWNRALSASEIFNSMYHELNGDETGLAAYYKMSDGQGSILTDDSVNSWNGVLYDGVPYIPPNGSLPQWVISDAFANAPITDTPSGPTATFTNTPVPPTPTNTNTPAPPTATFTNTPVPPTPTFTWTPDPNQPTNTPTFTPEANSIFADGFESGDLGAWTSAVTDGGDLSVSPAAAIEGAYGLQALINDTRPMYVQDDSPANETAYRAVFRLDPNSLAMNTNHSFNIFTGHNASGGFMFILEVIFSGGQYNLRLSTATDGTSWLLSPLAPISDAPHRLEVEWNASSAIGANNGSMILRVDGLQAAAITGVDNDTRRIDRVRLGPNGGLDPGTAGTIYFDSFESFRGAGGPTPTFTNTPSGPTATFTNTPVPPTPTFTNTPAPPTATPTNTPVPPTPTFTWTPDPNQPTNTPTFTPEANTIFADGFESGDLGAWTSAVTDGGDLSVSPAAAIEGAYGMQALINDTRQLYVQDESPSAEAVYLAGFRYDVNGMVMANMQSHNIFTGHNATGGFMFILEVIFSGGQYNLRISTPTDGGSWRLSPLAPFSDAPHQLEVEWTAASAPGANNGSMILRVDGLQAAAITGLDNDTRRIDTVRLGPSVGIDPGTTGAVSFDSFFSHR